MENIVRDVRDIDADDRHALEHVVGRPLHENQRIIIQVAEIENPAASAADSPRPRQTIEEWTRFYEGLSEREIEEIDKLIKTRANLTRSLP